MHGWRVFVTCRWVLGARQGCPVGGWGPLGLYWPAVDWMSRYEIGL